MNTNQMPITCTTIASSRHFATSQDTRMHATNGNRTSLLCQDIFNMNFHLKKKRSYDDPLAVVIMAQVKRNSTSIKDTLNAFSHSSARGP